MRTQHPTQAFKYLILALGLQFVGVSWAHAQASSIFGGTRTVGSSSSAGTRSAFGSAGSTSAFGSSNAMGGSTASGGLGQLGNTGQLTGSERYLRDNRTGAFVGSDTQDRGFVGAANSSAANGMGGMSGRTSGLTGRTGSSLSGRNSMMGGMGGFGGMNGFGGMGGFGGFNRNNLFGMNNRMGSASQRRVQVRTQLRADFAYAPIAPTKATTNLQARMDRTLRLRTASPLSVALDEQGVVVLRGQVASEDDRQLAVRLAKLEPGVETVRDELTVLAAESSATP